MQPETTSFPCFKCGTPVNVEPILQALAARHGTYCPGCLDSITAQKTQDRIKSHAGQLFTKLCPPCFLNSELMMLPCGSKSAKAMDWRFGPTGLVLFGEADTGKSRTASLIVQREVSSGRSAAALGPGDFKRELEARKFNTGRYIRWLSKCDLLFLDDIGSWHLFLPGEQELFSVLNARATRRPVICTSNQNAAGLSIKFKMGEPLVRRIRDFCEHVHFSKADLTRKPSTPTVSPCP